MPVPFLVEGNLCAFRRAWRIIGAAARVACPARHSGIALAAVGQIAVPWFVRMGFAYPADALTDGAICHATFHWAFGLVQVRNSLLEAAGAVGTGRKPERIAAPVLGVVTRPRLHELGWNSQKTVALGG